jgi:hypothetical protein
MDDAAPGQTRPSLGEVVDVVGAAMRQRLGATRTTAALVGWGPSAIAVGVVVAVLVLARQARPVVADMVWSWRFGEQGPTLVGAVGWARLAGWALVVAALVTGRARLAAVGAWAAVVTETAVLLGVGSDPAGRGWHLLLATAVAVLLSSALLSVPDRVDVPRRAWTALAVLGLVVALAAAGEPLVASRDGDFIVIANESQRLIALATQAAVVLLSLAAALSLAPSVRRRALVLLASVASLLIVAQLGYDSAFSSVVARQALIPSPALALALAAITAAAVFWVGVVAVQLRERSVS